MTALKQHIIEKVHQSGGKIPFSDYMEMVLYTPELGYYTGKSHPIGRHGDFITAPELSPLFGKCLAKTIRSILASVKNPTILEFGAGTGKLAFTLLEELECLDHYSIIEISPHLKEQQEKILTPYLSKVSWLDHLPKDCVE